MPAKQHAIGRERIEVRRLEARMTHRGEAVCPPLIEGHQEDVLAPTCGHGAQDYRTGRLIATMPMAQKEAAAIRQRPNGSRSSTLPIPAAITTPVSRTAAIGAIAPRLSHHITIPHASN